jgi:hypothetical protein
VIRLRVDTPVAHGTTVRDRTGMVWCWSGTWVSTAPFIDQRIATTTELVGRDAVILADAWIEGVADRDDGWEIVYRRENWKR